MTIGKDCIVNSKLPAYVVPKWSSTNQINDRASKSWVWSKFCSCKLLPNNLSRAERLKQGSWKPTKPYDEQILGKSNWKLSTFGSHALAQPSQGLSARANKFRAEPREEIHAQTSSLLTKS